MQTFLPSPDFLECGILLNITPGFNGAKSHLDNQIDEALSILTSLLDPRKAASLIHPVYMMWRGYEMRLWEYARDMLTSYEMKSGFMSHSLYVEADPRRELLNSKLIVILALYPLSYNHDDLRGISPAWLGDERLHSSHRAVLLGKQCSYYGLLGWKEQPAVKNSKGKWPYYWPVISPSIIWLRPKFVKVDTVLGRYITALTSIPCPCGRGLNILQDFDRCSKCLSDDIDADDHLSNTRPPL